MLNTKQRAQLRAMANPLAVTLIIGKEGVTDAVERELDALLESHELVKGKVLESAMLTPRTVSEALCEATGADALFLDVRTPWDYLKHIPAAVTPGAALAFLLPTVDQVGKLLLGLEQGPFDDVEVCEILVRRWKPIADRLRPEDRMVAHTGFLIFARHQERSAKWDECRTASLGTRERKQEAARRERLGLDGMETASEQIDE